MVEKVKTMNDDRLLSELTLGAINEEATRAHIVHGDNSMMGFKYSASDRLSILMEEVGEVAREINDARLGRRPADKDKLVIELIQVAAMAATWVEFLDGVIPNLG
jgi:hypothetical protein